MLKQNGCRLDLCPLIWLVPLMVGNAGGVLGCVVVEEAARKPPSRRHAPLRSRAASAFLDKSLSFWVYVGARRPAVHLRQFGTPKFLLMFRAIARAQTCAQTCAQKLA